MADRAPFELVLPRDLWERTMRVLLVSPNLVAVGHCRRNHHDAAQELIVESLQTTDALPRGDQQPANGDWVVLAVPTGSPGDQVQAWLLQLQPLPTQLLAVALVGLGADRSGWDGAVVENGQIRPLDAIRVTGPGMLVAHREEAQLLDEPSIEELQRWSRTRGALGEETWRKVAGSRVLLFGAGRNGSALAYLLVLLGVRSLAIVDPDELRVENLDASFGLTEVDVGRLKVEALQERLLAFRSSCAITSIPHPVNHGSVVRQARGVDMIASCVDDDTPRLAAAMLANRFLKVHLDVGTSITRDSAGHTVMAGDVRLLLPRQGCVCCVGGLANEDRSRRELLTPAGALPEREEVPWQEQRAGSLITLNGLTVSTAVQLWLDLLAGTLRSSCWQRLLWRAGGGIQSDFAPVTSRLDCRVCGNSDARK